jgi:hypothetical protein
MLGRASGQVNVQRRAVESRKWSRTRMVTATRTLLRDGSSLSPVTRFPEPTTHLARCHFLALIEARGKYAMISTTVL